MIPTPTTSTRPQWSPTCSSWTRRRSSPTKSLLRTPTTMTLHSRLHQAHRAQAYHSLQEDLFVSLSSSSMSDRTGRPVGDRTGDPLSNETRKHRLGLCSTSKKSKFLQSAKQDLTNTNFKQLEPKKFNNEINSFFKDNYCSKIWNYVKLIREVSLKWKS